MASTNPYQTSAFKPQWKNTLSNDHFVVNGFVALIFDTNATDIEITSRN